MEACIDELPCMHGASSALEGLFPCLRLAGSLSRLCVMSGAPNPVDECAEHMPEGRSCSGCGVGVMQSLAGRFVGMGVAVSFLSMSVHGNTETLRLN